MSDYYCKPCKRTFEGIRGFREHTVQKHPNKTIDCPRCEQPIRGKIFREHLDNHPECPFCSRPFISDDVVATHARRHHEATRCTCGEYTKAGETLKHWTESKSHPTCPACGDGFENHIVLEQHYLSRHNQIFCVWCSTVFSSQEDLDNHKEALHSTKPPDGTSHHEGNLVKVETRKEVPQVPPGLGFSPTTRMIKLPHDSPLDVPHSPVAGPSRLTPLGYEAQNLSNSHQDSCHATIQFPKTLKCPECKCTLRLKLELVPAD